LEKQQVMEALEFLGGKYNKPEQVVPGPVQTFRAHNAATGRPVYIHRVSMGEEQQTQQAALLRLLMTALFRSPSAHRLVLDFGEEQGYWYVVTECEPQCLLLREWLQFEIDNAGAAPAAPPPPVAKAPEVKPPSPPPSNGPGEFTRMFQAIPAAHPAPQPPAPQPPAGQPRATPPGEGPARSEPGEFTRFFREGLPGSAPKPSPAPAPPRAQERPSNPDLRRAGVQRPSTPVPPITPRPTESGEFTRLFKAHQSPSPAPAAPQEFGFNNPRFGEAPDLGKPKPETPDIFNLSAEAPRPLASASQEPGEYTRLFGKSDVPAVQKPSVVAAPVATPMVDDSSKSTCPLPAAAPPPAPPPAPVIAKAPSEFTQVLRGNRPSSPPADMPLAGQAPAPALVVEPVKVNITPPTPPSIPKPQIPPVSMPAPPAVAVAANSKTMVVFFVILGVLAVLLVILIVLLTTKK
jgi:hypothetical protein